MHLSDEKNTMLLSTPQPSLLTRFRSYLNPESTLALVCLVMLAIVILRFYHASVTGYMLPDEFYYYEKIVLREQSVGRRELFTVIYTIFFGNVRSISGLILAGAAYASAWGIGTAILAYKINRSLEIPDEVQSLLLVSLLFFPINAIMLPMLLTEMMALFFAMVGIYFALRFHRHGMWTDALFSSLAFVAAHKVREPYLLFGLVNFVGILMSNKRSIRSSLAYLIPIVLVFPAPLSVFPLRFAQPVYALLPDLAQRAYTYLVNLGVGPTTTLPTTTVAHTQTSLLTTTAYTQAQTTGLVTATGPATSVSIMSQKLGSLLYAFVIGLVFGYNPVFAVLGLASVFLAIGVAWRKRTAVTSLPMLNGLAGLGAYIASLLVLVYPASGLIPVWTSTVIRAAHVSLPAVFTFGRAYRRIGTRNVVAVFLVILVVGSTQIPVFSEAIQSRLTRTGVTVDRFSLSYRAPYYRLYELARDSGKTIVFASNLRGARTYLSMLPNAESSTVPQKQDQFRELLAKGWDTIFLYDYFYTISDPSSLKRYPGYYREILLSQTYPGYEIELLWVDSESYAFKMSPVASAQA